MPLEYIRIEKVPNEEQIILTEKLWLTADQNRVVQDGDPDAAFLLGTPGKKIPKSEAARLGLLGDDEKVEYYEDMTVERLKELLNERELPVSGNKQELIDRLIEHDEESDNDNEEDHDG